MLKLNQLKETLDKYSLYLIDMDNTLYDEHDFVQSGFRAVADHLATWGIDSTEAYNYLQQRFDTVGREKIFDHLLEHFVGTACPERILEMVRVYREHTPKVHLFPGAADVLCHMRNRGQVIIVTDGLPEVQQRKVKALELDKLADQIVYCWATGYPKPDPRSLQGIVEYGNPNALLIGDREDHDGTMATQLNIAFVQIAAP